MAVMSCLCICHVEVFSQFHYVQLQTEELNDEMWTYGNMFLTVEISEYMSG